MGESSANDGESTMNNGNGENKILKLETDEMKETAPNDDVGLITVHQPLRCVDHKTGQQEIHPDGKEAETSFKFISYDDESDSSLVECYPKTGRTHQIRLHLQYLGHPIVNDVCYGGDDNNKTHWIPGNEEEKGS